MTCSQYTIVLHRVSDGHGIVPEDGKAGAGVEVDSQLRAGRSLTRSVGKNVV